LQLCSSSGTAWSFASITDAHDGTESTRASEVREPISYDGMNRRWARDRLKQRTALMSLKPLPPWKRLLTPLTFRDARHVFLKLLGSHSPDAASLRNRHGFMMAGGLPKRSPNCRN
jgi:hypothetical protein